MTSNETSQKPPRKKFRKRNLLLLLAGLLIVGGWIAWGYIDNKIRSQLATQLADLDLGDVEIADVGLKRNGIFAEGIRFTRPGSDEAWLTVNRLSVDEPITNLMKGDSRYDRIKIAGSRMVIDLEEASTPSKGSTSNEPRPEFDLKQIVLPADRIDVADSNLILRSSDRPDFKISNLNVSLVDVDSKIKLDGSAELLNGQSVVVSGSIEPKSDQLSVNLQADEFNIAQDQWVNWPGVPDFVGKYISLGGKAKIDLQLLKQPNQSLTFSSTIDPRSVDVRLIYFDLPLHVSNGKLRLTNRLLQFENLTATTGDVGNPGTIVAAGTTTFSGFPVTTEFTATLENVSDSTVRKLVPDLPIEVATHLTGDVTGKVSVENSFATQMTIIGDASSQDLKYGEIAANRSKMHLQLDALDLTSELEVARLAGDLKVVADTDVHPLADVLRTFELTELQQELGLVANTKGNVELDLPFETINDLRTWQLSIGAHSTTAQFRGKKLKNLNTNATLEQGRLVFKSITADVEPEPQESQGESAHLDLEVDWPIATVAPDAGIGRIKVKGTSIAPQWLLGVAEFEPSATRPVTPSNRDLDELPITGKLNFETTVNLSSTQPDDIQSWQIDGTVFDSLVTASDARLEEFKLSFTARDGQLALNNGDGKFAGGGNFGGSAKINLNDMSLESTTLRGTEIPLDWAVSLASRLNSEIERVLTEANINGDNIGQQLKGKFSADLTLLPNTKTPTQLADFEIGAMIESPQLEVQGQVLREVAMAARFNNSELLVSKLNANLNSGGSVSGSGSWQFESEEGAGNLSWRDLPVDWISDLAGQKLSTLAGTVSGDVQLSSVPADAQADRFPVAIEGTLAAKQISVGSLSPQSFSVDVKTNRSVLEISRFRDTNRDWDVDISGSVDLSAPHQFSLTSKLDAFDLAAIVDLFALAADSSDGELDGLSDELSGRITGQASVSGRLSPLDWETTGEATVSEITYQQQPIETATAKWNHLGADWAQSRAEISVFGGKVTMKELVRAPQRVAVEIENIDAKQLTALADLPVKFSGKLSGEASLNEWSLEQTRWVDLKIAGASTEIGYGEFGDLDGHLKYRNQNFDYGLTGKVLNGSFESVGETQISADGLAETRFPIKTHWHGAKLAKLHQSSNYLRSLHGLEGDLFFDSDLEVSLNQLPSGTGQLGVENFKWNRELLSRRATMTIKLSDEAVEISDIQADLKRGQISGRAKIPLRDVAGGRYELEIRKFDLERLSEIIFQDKDLMEGMFDARISGQIGQSVTGRGELGLARADLFGLAGQSFKLPIEFRIDPVSQRGRIELRRTQIRMFNGRVSGKASLEFGNSVNLNVDTTISNIETGDLFRSLTGSQNKSQGRLNGRLVLNGRGIRSGRDLKGSFKGELDRVQSFRLPLLKDLALFLNSGSMVNRNFDSNDINLELANGAIDVKNLTFTNSLAKVAITGKAYLDRRLDLQVATRVERISQPSLVEEFTQSPLARFPVTPLAFLGQAADFLSDRIVFVKVGGTFSRPSFRLDTGPQVREELIRYFLLDANLPGIKQALNR